jgi:hypothetical protein
MRRVLILTILVLLLAPTVNAAPGTSETCSDVQYNATDPYEVWNAKQLQCMEPGGDYGLQSDINMSETSGWNDGNGFYPVPLWNSSGGFNGSLDGNGYSITGLTVHRPEEGRVGLFGRIGSGGTVSNLRLVDVNVTGDDNVGGLAGDVSSGANIRDVTVEGRVAGDSAVGGVVGSNNGTVMDLTSRVTFSGNETGGLVGVNDGTLKNTTNTGSELSGFGVIAVLIASVISVGWYVKRE